MEISIIIALLEVAILLIMILLASSFSFFSYYFSLNYKGVGREVLCEMLHWRSISEWTDLSFVTY